MRSPLKKLKSRRTGADGRVSKIEKVKVSMDGRRRKGAGGRGKKFFDLESDGESNEPMCRNRGGGLAPKTFSSQN